MNNNSPDIHYLDGHRATHIGNGIYKLDEPIRINFSEWMLNQHKWFDYAFLTVILSDNPRICDLTHFVKDSGYRELDELGQRLKKLENKRYSYFEWLHSNMPIRTRF